MTARVLIGNIQTVNERAAQSSRTSDTESRKRMRHAWETCKACRYFLEIF
nr:MAG TPA: hypothetical protein [Caudoviricetes sp.]